MKRRNRKVLKNIDNPIVKYLTKQATAEEIKLLEEILNQRRKELFAEWGFKLTGQAGQVLGAGNPLWNATDLLYPIPESERKKNPNLTQNEGY